MKPATLEVKAKATVPVIEGKRTPTIADVTPPWGGVKKKPSPKMPVASKTAAAKDTEPRNNKEKTETATGISGPVQKDRVLDITKPMVTKSEKETGRLAPIKSQMMEKIGKEELSRWHMTEGQSGEDRWDDGYDSGENMNEMQYEQ